jgi:hypothetical protein
MDTPKTKTQDWQAILSIALSGLGVVYFLIQALSFGVLWVTNLVNSQGAMDQTISYGLLVWSSILSCLMLTPVLLFSYYQLKGQNPPKSLDTSRPIFRKTAGLLIMIWPFVVFIGWLVAGRPGIAAFLLGPINILVAGLPILWIYTSATKGVDRGLQVRQWRIFGFSLAVTPLFAIVLEIIALLILGGFIFLWLSYQSTANPGLEQDLMYIINQASNRQGDIEAVLEILNPYLIQPGFFIWGFVVFAGVIPIIEELIKPIALWLMAGRKISPQEGFVGGLLCGAGFALMENVLYFTASSTAMDWLYLAIGRASTGILHMLASGLVGWGLGKAWRDGKWLFLGGMSLLAILLHGFWNALSLGTSLASLLLLDSNLTVWQEVLLTAPSLILLLLSAISIALIKGHFKKQNHPKTTISKEEKGNESQDIH